MDFCLRNSSKTSLLFALINTEIIFVIYDQRLALSGCIHFLSLPFLVSHFYSYLVLLPKKSHQIRKPRPHQVIWWCPLFGFPSTLPLILGQSFPLNSNPSSKLVCWGKWCSDAKISSTHPVLHWCFSRFLIREFFPQAFSFWWQSEENLSTN